MFIQSYENSKLLLTLITYDGFKSTHSVIVAEDDFLIYLDSEISSVYCISIVLNVLALDGGVT